nr:WH2 domain-containing protein [Rickettsia endosymbiont of Ceutorhynchus assimilis]
MEKEEIIKKALTTEKANLVVALNKVNELLETNRQLNDLSKIQKEVNILKKEQFHSLPWFKKFIEVVSNVKYVFVKNEEQLTKEAIRHSNETLRRVDNILHRIAEKSAPLKEVMQEEFRKNFETLSSRKDLSIEQQEKLNKLAESYKESATVHLTEVLKTRDNNNLASQLISLNNVKNNIATLLKENKHVTKLAELKYELENIKSELPSTFLEKLSKSFQKIKYIFVNTPEQAFQGNKQKTIEKLGHIDTALGKIKSSLNTILENKAKLDSELNKLRKPEFVLTQITEIEEKLTKPISISPLQNDELKVPDQVTPPTVIPEDIKNTPNFNIPLPPPPPPPLLPTAIVPPPPPPPLPSGVAKETEHNEPKPSERQESDRDALLSQIQQGIKLKEVKAQILPKKPQTNSNVDVAAILARRIALSVSDSESETESDSDWESDTSSNKKKSLKAKRERDEEKAKHGINPALQKQAKEATNQLKSDNSAQNLNPPTSRLPQRSSSRA